MATRTLTVKLVGDHKNLDAAFRNAGGAAQRFGRIARQAILGVGVAAAGLAVKAVADFAKFDTGMREVFTLLPDVSQAAMDEMSEQVKQLSADMGVLPDEVVPALYSALSAGVPQDNVFAFLETAQMAALGGVTDLETAVDGISSVMNAFGDAVAGPAEASDLMFTAVRLGKTTFEELSASLFQVNPIAAALGVQFGDVTAGLATMTAQGIPTRIATTQMRQLFVELSKAGGKAAETFESMAGKTFQDFVGEGGNVAEALTLMGQAAADGGVELQDMFGSVEAGAAALALTSGDFAGAIAEMGDSAGATAAAYETMNGGVARQLDILKAKFAVLLLDIGEKLAPIAIKAVDFLLVAFDKMGPVIVTVGEALAPVIQAFKTLFGGGDLKENLRAITTQFVDWAVSLWPGVKTKLIEFGEAVVEWVKEYAPIIAAKLLEWGAAFIEWALPVWVGLQAKLVEVSTRLLSWLAENLDVIVLKLLDWAEAFVAWVAPMIPPLLLELAKIQAKVAWWVVSDFLPKLLASLGTLGATVTTKMFTLLGSAGSNLINGLWNGLVSKWQWLKDKVNGYISDIKGWFTSGFGIFSPSKVFAEFGEFMSEGLAVGLTVGAGAHVQPAVGAIVGDTIAPFAAGASGGGRVGGAVNITVNALPGMNEAMLADAIAKAARKGFL